MGLQRIRLVGSRRRKKGGWVADVNDAERQRNMI